MADTPRSVAELVIADIITKAKRVTETNGYDFNIGQNGVLTRAVDVTTVVPPKLIVIRHTTTHEPGDQGNAISFGNALHRMQLQIGWIFEDKSDEGPALKAERIVENVNRFMPLQATMLSDVWTDATTKRSGYCYVLRRSTSIPNHSQAVPGKVHGHIDYTAEFETDSVDDRFAR